MSEVDTRWWGECARRLFETNQEHHTSELDEEDWPREPSEYVPTDHFINKKKDNERHIDGKHIRECIEEGDFCPTFESKALFHKEFHGVSFYLVVGSPNGGRGYFEAVSMYPWVKSKGEALTSGYWTKSEVEDIRKLNKRWMEQEGRAEYIASIDMHAEIRQ